MEVTAARCHSHSRFVSLASVPCRAARHGVLVIAGHDLTKEGWVGEIFRSWCVLMLLSQVTDKG